MLKRVFLPNYITPFFHIVIPFFLILVISKEIFSYEDEKVVVLCILTLLTIATINTKEMIYESLSQRAVKVHNEIYELLDINYDMCKYLRRFMRIYLDLEDSIAYIYSWIKVSINKIIIKLNKHRALFMSNLIKDKLNFLLTDWINIQYNLKLYLINLTFNNIKINIQNNDKLAFKALNLPVLLSNTNNNSIIGLILSNNKNNQYNYSLAYLKMQYL